MENAAGFKDAVQIFHYVRIVSVLQNILAQNLIKVFIWKRERKRFNVVHDINTRNCRRVKIYPLFFDISPASDIEPSLCHDASITRRTHSVILANSLMYAMVVWRSLRIENEYAVFCRA